MKRVVVVGYAGGLGTAITKRLGACYSLGGVDVSEKAVEPSFSVFHADLRSDEDIRNACLWATHDGPLWAIVFTAGVYPIMPFDQYTRDAWDETFAVNVRSAFYVCHTLAPQIESGGRIVLVASAAAHSGSRDLAYSSSKTALLGLTRSLALNLASKQILVNAVCPGPVVTEMSDRMTAEHKQFWLDRVPLRRFGDPDEVAVAVEFLLDSRNSFMTGTCLNIDGGLTTL